MFVCRHVRQRVTSINQLAVAYGAWYHRVIVVVGGCCCVSVAATNLMKHAVLERREVVGRRHVLADLRTPCVATCYRSLNFIYIYISRNSVVETDMTRRVIAWWEGLIGGLVERESAKESSGTISRDVGR